MSAYNTTKFSRGHYAVSWDKPNDIGIAALILESDQPAIVMNAYTMHPGFRARLYVTEADLDKLIQTLTKFRKKMFGG